MELRLLILHRNGVVLSISPTNKSVKTHIVQKLTHKTLQTLKFPNEKCCQWSLPALTDVTTQLNARYFRYLQVHLKHDNLHEIILISDVKVIYCANKMIKKKYVVFTNCFHQSDVILNVFRRAANTRDVSYKRKIKIPMVILSFFCKNNACIEF